MKLREENVSDLTVEQIFAARCEQSVRERACAESGALSWDVTITPDGDGATIRVDRVMPPRVPDFARKFVGDSIAITQTERWRGADEQGARRVDVRLTIKGQPATMVATGTVEARGAGSVEILEGEVKVAVPFLGRKIEPEIVRVIASALRVEQRVGLEWVYANS